MGVMPFIKVQTPTTPTTPTKPFKPTEAEIVKALDAEKKLTFNDYMQELCIGCRDPEREVKGRGLCNRCYMDARRNKELHLFPTNAMREDPDDTARAMWGYFKDNVMDIAPEFGYVVLTWEEYQDLKNG